MAWAISKIERIAKKKDRERENNLYTSPGRGENDGRSKTLTTLVKPCMERMSNFSVPNINLSKQKV